MRLLVTGGAGFIGSNFIQYWIKKYPIHYVVNVDKLTYAGNLENLKSIQNNASYSFVHADICNMQQMDTVMKDIDVVVHFAAESHVDRSILDADPFVQTNVVGTHTLLKLALKHKVKRFHHVSTDEVFGSLELGSKERFSEETPYNPHSPYSASKAGSDHLVRAYYDTYGLPITITNCSNNYGPFQFPEKLISLAITNLIEGKKIPVYGDGLYVRDWLYVEDHCEAIDAVINNGKVGETYCVGSMTQDVANKDIIEMICKLMDKNPSEVIEHVEDRPGHDRRYAIDFSKITKDLGWKPNTTFEEGLKKTIEWYRDNEEWWRHIKSGEYTKYYETQYKNR